MTENTLKVELWVVTYLVWRELWRWQSRLGQLGWPVGLWLSRASYASLQWYQQAPANRKNIC